MIRIKNYPNLHRLCKRGLLAYIIIAAVITIFSLVMVFIYYPPTEDGFLEVLGLVLVFDALVWLPGISKYESRKAQFKKFTDEGLARLNEEIPSIEHKKSYLVTEDALIINEKEMVIIPTKELLWIYNKHIHTTHKTLGVVTGTSDTFYTMIIRKKQKSLCITKSRYWRFRTPSHEVGSVSKRNFFGIQ